MSHALSAIDLALRGDAGGLSFLERTAAIYVLDAATTPGKLTTYGWWNFLNDALNEVERYEASSSPPDLGSHVRLLATITRRVARRPPSSDRRLIGTCLANASMSHMHLLASPEIGQFLVQNNDEMRERNMGRIASIVFDFSFYRTNSIRRSAFSDPVALEQFCGVVAANAVSTGPDAVKYLIADWIVPSIESLPPYAVVAMMSHISIEAMGKGCPVGTKAVIQSLLETVLKKAVGPLMTDALRESDGGYSVLEIRDTAPSGAKMSQRIAALSFRALESWCRSTSTGIVQLRQIFSSTNINILETIADAMYSDAAIVTDAVSDLLDVLLDFCRRDSKISSGLDIAQSLLGMMKHSNQLDLAQQLTSENRRSKIIILSELVSAIGLQRFRFSERQRIGDNAVCRCLARMAARILLEAEDDIKKGSMETSLDGIFDLLFKAMSHPSLDVSGIALEALSAFVHSEKGLSTRLLPLLQGKAIIPFHLVSGEDINGFEEYRNFRERVLNDALVACYEGCGLFFLESCCSAIEEFCIANQSSHLPYQFEAALFCMIAVSEEIAKPLRRYQHDGSSLINVDADAQQTSSFLERIVSALAKNAFSSTSHPLVMARMCIFLNKYATVFPLCSSENTFETASELALSSFNRSLEGGNYDAFLDSCDVKSPLSESCNALQQLLRSCPAHFSAPTAMNALENAWKMPYACRKVDIEDRESLCSGLCYVISSLPSEQWSVSVENLAKPLVACLSVLAKEADTEKNCDIIPSVMKRISHEILLLSSIVRYFDQADVSNLDDGKRALRGKVLVTLLNRNWSCLKHIGETYSSQEVVAEAIGRLLSDSLWLYKSVEELSFLRELSNLAKTSMLGIAKTNKPTSLPSLLLFVKTMVELHGQNAETSLQTNDENSFCREIVVDLIMVSYEAVRLCPRLDVTNGSSDASTQGSNTSTDLVSSMFATLSSCAKHCPRLLVVLAKDDQPLGELLRLSVEAAPDALKAREVEVALSAVAFLEMLITSASCLTFDDFEDTKKSAALSALHRTMSIIHTNVLASSLVSVCEAASQEVVGPTINLIKSILKHSQWDQIEGSIGSALNSNQFKLGDAAREIMFDNLKQCSMNGYPPANFDGIIAEIWQMHQTDDTGAIAGGEAVAEFVKRYFRQ